MKYLLIGGGLAGGHAAGAIREHDKDGELLLLSDEKHLPYDRVPLSKAYLTGKAKLDNIFFRKKSFYDENKVELLNGHSAATLDRKNRSVTIDDGREIGFEKLLLATGGRARKINLPGSELKRIHYLRTLEDCEELKVEMAKSQKAVVVGGGFIGCELAAAFRARGLETTVIEVSSSLLSLGLDPETADWVTDYFKQQGVNVMTNSSASGFIGTGGTVSGTETSGGTVPADFVAVGIGIIPNTDLAEKAGLKTEKGIVVDEYLETEERGVFAAGDVARFYSPLFGHHLRLEHYDVAVKQGKAAGSNMAGDRRAFSDIPYFFSFMFDLNINVYGDMSARQRAVRRGSLSKESGFFQFYFSGDRLVAFLSMNRSRDEMNSARKMIASGKPIPDSASLSDESRNLDSFL